ncbi:allatostatin-A receptor-like [Centruroides sculpturatus]|uniref:allatostatin-A receptor-like n=1 Tax=Centruroides sculpturatus TaxID=218467 RepID=UPI000C6C89DA|nr:allatostatin-A receptor-like [Centruroides sculpturatus]
MSNRTCTPGNFPCKDQSYIYMDNPEDMLNPLSINSSFLSIILTHMITFIVGVTGNSIVIATWTGMRPSRSYTCTFLVSLAVSDLLLLLIYFPLETIEYFVITWDTDGGICKVSSYFEMLSSMAAVLNLTAVSFERFIVIIFPMRARRLCTLSTCRKGLFIVWLLAVLFSIPVLLTKKIYPITYYNNYTSITAYYCFDSDDYLAFCVAVYQLVSIFALPAFFMSVFYFWVIRELWSSTKTIINITRTANNENRLNACCRHNQPTTRLNSARQRAISIKVCSLHRQQVEVRKARQQVIKMLIFVIVLFMICWGPRLMMNVIIKKGLTNFNHSAYSARIACNLLSFVHSALNPFVYGFMSSNFRKVLIRACSSYSILFIFCGYCMVPRSRTETLEFSTYTTSIRRSRTRNSLELTSRGQKNVLVDRYSV